MNSDIRVEVSFLNHRKRRRLERLIGVGATHYLINLWITASMQAPSGILEGWDDQDIAEAAQWPDDAATFVDALMKCGSPRTGFIERNGDGVYHLHDWQEHQPWVVGAPERQEKARKAGLASAQKRQVQQVTDHPSTPSQQQVNSESTNSATPILTSPILTSPILTKDNVVGRLYNMEGETHLAAADTLEHTKDLFKISFGRKASPQECVTLKSWVKKFPTDSFAYAFKEAADLNKLHLDYIFKILERLENER